MVQIMVYHTVSTYMMPHGHISVYTAADAEAQVVNQMSADRRGSPDTMQVYVATTGADVVNENECNLE